MGGILVVWEDKAVVCNYLKVVVKEENASGEGWHLWQLRMYDCTGTLYTINLPDTCPTAERAMAQVWKHYDVDTYTLYVREWRT